MTDFEYISGIRKGKAIFDPAQRKTGGYNTSDTKALRNTL